MKRKIFTFTASLALSAALIISAQAANAPSYTQRSRSVCPETSVSQPCLPGWCRSIPCAPSQSETPDTPDVPEAPDTPDTPETPDTPDTPDSGSTSSYARQVLDLVNRERALYGLDALSLDDTLSRYAAVKSQDMHDSGYFSHTSPT